MGNDVDLVVRRFIKALKDGDDMRKIHTILSSCSKEDFMLWCDELGQNAMHYAVLADKPEAVDYLLKLGYFAPPHEPNLNMYAHLAARLGLRSVLATILQHRPEDFKVCEQPLILPRDAKPVFGKTPMETKEPEFAMPAVVGNQIWNPDKKRFSVKSSSRSSLGLFANDNGFLMHGRKFSNRVEQGDSPSGHRSRLMSAVPPDPVSMPGVQGQSYSGPRSSSTEKNSRRTTHVSGIVIAPSSEEPRHSLPIAIKTQPSNTKRRNSSPEESLVLDHGINLELLKPLACTPLEVAARYKHVECVRTLLDMYVLRAYPDLGKKGYLTLASLASDSACIKLLLHSARTFLTSNPTTLAAEKCKDDYRAAVEICLSRIYPDCLDALLSDPLVDPKSIFKNVNFYHVLYGIPGNTNKRTVALSRIPAMTKVLIKRGHDVKAKVPLRTYPLYTLIHNAFHSADFTFSEDVLACMKLLMENGADPNFDELEHEKSTTSSGAHPSSCRCAYPSALHCVMQCLEVCQDLCRGKAIRFAEECLEALTDGGADISKVGSMGYLRLGKIHDMERGELKGDILFQLAKSSVTLGIERGLLRCLLRFGAEPRRQINGLYALNVYLDYACGFICSKTFIPELWPKFSGDVVKMIDLLCAHMTPRHIKNVLKIFRERHFRCNTSDTNKKFGNLAEEALTAQKQTVRSLRSISAWQVWKLCDRKADKVKQLPVSKEMKTQVLPLLLFGTLW